MTSLSQSTASYLSIPQNLFFEKQNQIVHRAQYTSFYGQFANVCAFENK